MAATRERGDTRPLQLGSCDRKLIALLANTVLSQLASKVCPRHQTGAIRGRQIKDSI